MPALLAVVRHGESAANVAREAAKRAGVARFDLQLRDMDVPLSPLGERQARALGAWFCQEQQLFDIVLASPYRRAKATADFIVDAKAVTGAFESIFVDERLREKEFGILDNVTTAGIEAEYPAEFASHERLGKFYYRPPGGESWPDVILRLRSVLDTVALHFAGKRVLIVAHQIVVLCMRYLLEGISEEQLLAIDRDRDVENCSITEYRNVPHQGFVLTRYNWVVDDRRRSED
jgi:broad specificity phosphatase PhoE